MRESERELLLSIARDNAPEFCSAQIAREFAALAGRPITAWSVNRFLRGRLGLPGPGKGKGPREVAPSAWEEAIAEARAVKLAAAPVDRSVRPGRTSRIIA